MNGFYTKDGLVFQGDGLGLQQLLQAGTAYLACHVAQINRINVFPVPDGDTGTNMLLTMQAGLRAVEEASTRDASAAASAMAEGTLLGGRGNSGIILSQFWAGVAAGLDGKVRFKADDLSLALRVGADRAYHSVEIPIEGTILSVSRAAAQAVSWDEAVAQDLGIFFKTVVEAMAAAQRETSRQLPALQQLGVTDSGGLGLLYLFGGMWQKLDSTVNESVWKMPVIDRLPLKPNGYHNYGFDVQFLIAGNSLPLEIIRERLSTLGQSSMIVGNQHRIKVHLHTTEPDQLLIQASQYGSLQDVTIEDLTRQAEVFAETGEATIPAKSSQLAPKTMTGTKASPTFDTRVYNYKDVTLVAVVSGVGFIELFKREGATVVSAEQLLLTIEQTLGQQILVLPTDEKLSSKVKQLGTAGDKKIEIVPTFTVPQAIAALLAFNDRLDLATNLCHMTDAARYVCTVEIRPHQKEGQYRDSQNEILWQVYLDGIPVDHAVSPAIEAIVLDGVAQAPIANYELLTLYFGEQGDCEQAECLAEKIHNAHTGLVVEVVDGGHPQYPYIFGLE